MTTRRDPSSSLMRNFRRLQLLQTVLLPAEAVSSEQEKARRKAKKVYQRDSYHVRRQIAPLCHTTRQRDNGWANHWAPSLQVGEC